MPGPDALEKVRFAREPRYQAKYEDAGDMWFDVTISAAAPGCATAGYMRMAGSSRQRWAARQFLYLRSALDAYFSTISYKFTVLTS